MRGSGVRIPSAAPIKSGTSSHFRRLRAHALRSLSAVFIAQEFSCDTSPSILALTPNKSFGVISSISGD